LDLGAPTPSISGEGLSQEAEALLAQVRQKQLMETKDRAKGLARDNVKLKDDIKILEDKTTKEISRLTRENYKMKRDLDKLNKKLRDTLEKNREMKSKLNLDIAKAVSVARKEHESEIKSFLKEQHRLKREIEDMEVFKERRFQMATELEKANNEIKATKAMHREDVRQMERKFLQIRSKMQKEMEHRITNFKSECRSVVLKEIDKESQKLRLVNVQMSDEIRFHAKNSNELRKQLKIMKEKVNKQKMELDLAKQKDDMQSKRGAKQAGTIRRLRSDKHDLDDTILALKDELVDLSEAYTKLREAYETPTDEVATLRHHLAVKTGEVKRIKSLAQRILDQRGDVERFFLSSLEQVKEEIRKKKKRESKKQKKDKVLQLLALTKGKPMTAKNSTAREAAAKSMDNRRVDLSELSLEDRERVLRLLFSKINTSTRLQDRIGQFNPNAALQVHSGYTSGLDEEKLEDNTFLTNHAAGREQVAGLVQATALEASKFEN